MGISRGAETVVSATESLYLFVYDRFSEKDCSVPEAVFYCQNAFEIYIKIFIIFVKTLDKPKNNAIM